MATGWGKFLLDGYTKLLQVYEMEKETPGNTKERQVYVPRVRQIWAQGRTARSTSYKIFRGVPGAGL